MEKARNKKTPRSPRITANTSAIIREIRGVFESAPQPQGYSHFWLKAAENLLQRGGRPTRPPFPENPSAWIIRISPVGIDQIHGIISDVRNPL
jgi:hypothetical protein